MVLVSRPLLPFRTKQAKASALLMGEAARTIWSVDR